MNEQDRELLFIDLCGRLPYGVKCSHPYGIGKLESIAKEEHGIDVTFETPDDNYYSIDGCKPYLFPLSSMTEEQKVEYDKMSELDIEYTITQIENNSQIWTSRLNRFNWLLKNHFDVYGLIPMDLAIDATNLEIY